MPVNPKYKHTTYFKKSDLANVPYSVWSPTLKDWRDVIEDYIDISKKRKNNKLGMFKLQIELLGDVVIVNDTIKAYVKLLNDPEHRKKEFPNLENEEDTINYWKQELNSYKIILNSLKDIGDGIAWRVLNFDRSLIYNMCVNNEDSGPLTLNKGLLTELHSLGDFTNDPDVINFIYHGITNFLLIADLTIVYRNDEINFVEVKSGKPHGRPWRARLERQKAKAENIVKIANESKGMSSKVFTEFRIIDKKPQTILDRLDTLLKRVKDKPFVTQIFNSYLGIGLSNFAHFNKETDFEKLDKLAAQIKKQADDFIITPNSVDNFIFSPNRAPLSVHPFKSEDIANILSGKYLITYFFNISQFFKEIEKRGWKVSDMFYERTQNTDPSMFSVKKNNFVMKVPPSLTSRAIYEGLSVDSMIQIFEDSLIKGPSEDLYFFYGFKKEKFLWN